MIMIAELQIYTFNLKINDFCPQNPVDKDYEVHNDKNIHYLIKIEIW